MKAVEEAARAARGTVADLASVPDERLDAGAARDRGQPGPRFRPGARGQRGGHDRGAGRPASAAACWTGSGWTRRGWPPSRTSCGRWPMSRPNRPNGWSGSCPAAWCSTERRRPVGVIGANFEARPNVVVDIASQFVKSRNAGVLRTGSAAIRSAIALADEVIAPALAAAGLDPAMIQLVRVPGQASARALVSQPGLIPLVILRGSGDSTRSLAAEAARHGVRTMAHADGGAVLYVDAAADPAMAEQLIEASLDRLGVCNRLNLLLVHPARWDEFLPRVGRAAGPAGHRRVAAAARPPARPRVGAGRRARGDRHDRPGRRAARRGRARQRGDLGAGRGDRHRGPRRGGGVPRRLRRHRRVLERHHPPAGRVQAVLGAGDRDQHRRGARPARPGDLPRPVPAPVRGHPRVTRPARHRAQSRMATGPGCSTRRLTMSRWRMV